MAQEIGYNLMTCNPHPTMHDSISRYLGECILVSIDNIQLCYIMLCYDEAKQCGATLSDYMKATEHSVAEADIVTNLESEAM